MEGLFIKVKANEMLERLQRVHEMNPETWIFVTNYEKNPEGVGIKGTVSDQVAIVTHFVDEQNATKFFATHKVAKAVPIPSDVCLWEVIE